jgi:hypothetical protein
MTKAYWATSYKTDDDGHAVDPDMVTTTIDSDGTPTIAYLSDDPDALTNPEEYDDMSDTPDTLPDDEPDTEPEPDEAEVIEGD